MPIWIDVKLPSSFACFSESSENKGCLAWQIFSKKVICRVAFLLLLLCLQAVVPPFLLAKCVKCSAILYTLPKQLNPVLRILRCHLFFVAFMLPYWHHFPHLMNVIQIWSTKAVYEEFAMEFKPIRSREIFWMNNNWFPANI